MRYPFFLAVLLWLAVSPATATPVNCLTAVGSNVLALTDGCYLGDASGPLIFDQFKVSGVPSPPGSSVFLSSIGTGFSLGEWANLGFQITTPNPPSDTILEYRVTGYINGVDNSHNGIDTRIQEIVCATAFQNGVCPATSVLANFSNNGGSAVVWFAPQTQVWIQKDILLNQSTSFISSFTNSHHVPEPLTSLLVGAGLAGIGLFRRRLRPGSKYGVND